MDCMSFNYFFDSSEASYSKVIAQTFVLSTEFRKLLFEQINQKHDNNIIKQMTTEAIENVVLEKTFDGNCDRIDIFFELKNGLMIGVENKKWAGLQHEQLIRYKKALENLNQNYVLIFLAPKNYMIPQQEKPENLKNGVFIEINYAEIDEICKKILSNTQEDLVVNYFRSLKNFIGELIMEPLNQSEINSLRYFSSADKKINQILSDLKFENGIEKNENYRLGYKVINGQSCYCGFRFGTKCYYREPLLDDQPEMIFYIKDDEPDFDNASKNNDKLKEFYTDYNKPLSKQFLSKVDYYDRKKANECRLAIRKSLADFESEDVSKIVNWFESIIKYLEQNL